MLSQKKLSDLVSGQYSRRNNDFKKITIKQLTFDFCVYKQKITNNNNRKNTNIKDQQFEMTTK